MHFLIQCARWIDRVNEKIANAISWALMVAVLVCAGSALASYFFKLGSNAWYEIQWYLYGAMFLFTAPYTLRRNEHVRIDVITHRFSKRTQVWIDVFGFLLFLLPMAILIFYLSVPFALESIRNQEMSNNAGGLIVWPAKLMIPTGFLLLCLQGLSELIKRIGYLCGLVDASEFEKTVVTPEDEIAAIRDANLDKIKSIQSH
ncbi:TRAP transporter small permease subunit [Undibacterium sp. LX40W]|uniref:TRAP transporter small permease protein n=1 Tax=Undibacterium nitidum TaxID=2762298 RepID=A0A923KK78_9BURK|nr:MULTISPECIES: TRAP transporter small permease subunit [Undibacterium]MBC3880485.1 TRAP transporter small permease subunit [Undibacterium nitidum]MBC3890779.1 TRAP transporter small permease subunit [Undibacterium sp. LX40W]